MSRDPAIWKAHVSDGESIRPMSVIEYDKRPPAPIPLLGAEWSEPEQLELFSDGDEQ